MFVKRRNVREGKFFFNNQKIITLLFRDCIHTIRKFLYASFFFGFFFAVFFFLIIPYYRAPREFISSLPFGRCGFFRQLFWFCACVGESPSIASMYFRVGECTVVLLC